MAVATNSLNINSSGVVSYNSTTGVFTESVLTQHFVLVGGASNAIVSVTPSSAGLVLTSNGTSVDPSFQAVPATGGFSWIDVTTSTQAVTTGIGYVTDNATLVTYTLPASPAFGNVFRITGGVSASATSPWTLAQNAGQQIKFGNVATTVGVSGSVAATLQYDGIELVCVVAGASAIWTVIASQGNLIVT